MTKRNLYFIGFLISYLFAMWMGSTAIVLVERYVSNETSLGSIVLAILVSTFFGLLGYESFKKYKQSEVKI